MEENSKCICSRYQKRERLGRPCFPYCFKSSFFFQYFPTIYVLSMYIVLYWNLYAALYFCTIFVLKYLQNTINFLFLQKVNSSYADGCLGYLPSSSPESAGCLIRPCGSFQEFSILYHLKYMSGLRNKLFNVYRFFIILFHLFLVGLLHIHLS